MQTTMRAATAALRALLLGAFLMTLATPALAAGGRFILVVGEVIVATGGGPDRRVERGDTVTVQSAGGRDLARGLVAYSSDEARRIMGRRSDAIEELLGYKGRGPLIHRDHLVLLRETRS